MVDTSEIKDPLPRREREKALHRKDIMDAAIAVFYEKGFYAATLDEIAQKAEFSKGTLYLYFQNKEDILFMILKETFEEQSNNLSKIISVENNFREEIRTLFYQLAEDLFRKPSLFSLLNTQHAALFKALSAEKRNELFSLHNRLWNQLEKWVTKAIEKKEIRPFTPESVTDMIHGSTASMLFNRWHCNTLDQLKKAIDIYLDMIFNGIVYRKESEE